MNVSTNPPEPTEEEIASAKRALDLALAANPDADEFRFHVTETGEFELVEVLEDTGAKSKAPDQSNTPEQSDSFLKRFMRGSLTRRNFTRKVATGGLLAAVGTFFIKVKQASASTVCWWVDQIYECRYSSACGATYNYESLWAWQKLYCCVNGQWCYYEGSSRWYRKHCGC